MKYRPSLEKGSDQLIVTLYTISINHNQLIRALFEARLVARDHKGRLYRAYWFNTIGNVIAFFFALNELLTNCCISV